MSMMRHRHPLATLASIEFTAANLIIRNSAWAQSTAINVQGLVTVSAETTKRATKRAAGQKNSRARTHVTQPGQPLEVVGGTGWGSGFAVLVG